MRDNPMQNRSISIFCRPGPFPSPMSRARDASSLGSRSRLCFGANVLRLAHSIALAGPAMIAAFVAFASYLALALSAAHGDTLAPSRGDRLPPRLVFPLACTLGETCYVQNHVDRAPGPEVRDAGCGQRSYNGHRGTDFRIGDPALLARGIPVRAAAPGVVIALRDGVKDRLRAPGAPWAEAGGECGNGVAIRTASGWIMRYCHLRRGSVRVDRGESVAAGTYLGIVGLSGDTTFPHLHFDIRRRGKLLDPYDIRPTPCPAKPLKTLWKEPLSLARAALIHAAFFDHEPKRPELVSMPPAPLPANPARLIGAVVAILLEADDMLELRILGPKGEILATHVDRVHRNQAERRIFLGIKRPPAGWKKGRYRFEARLVRTGSTVSSIAREIEIGE